MNQLKICILLAIVPPVRASFRVTLCWHSKNRVVLQEQYRIVILLLPIFHINYLISRDEKRRLSMNGSGTSFGLIK
jgi:hypothetical protein